MENANVIGPSLPPNPVSLPNSDDSRNEIYGPALPPGFVKADAEETVIGPRLPCSESLDSEDSDAEKSDSNPIIGPQLPPGFKTLHNEDTSTDESDEDDLIGPLPYEGDDQSLVTVKEEFDKRAQRMKNRLSGITETKPVEREEWMMTLPAQLKPTFGVGPRAFKRRNAPEDSDRSGWTSIQGKDDEKEKTAEVTVKTKHEFLPNAKDEHLSEFVKNYNSKSRSESLLDIHQKNRKRKLPEEPKERRPFDRSIDLESVHFDEAQRKALIKRSHQLNDRFSAGKAKFL